MLHPLPEAVDELVDGLRLVAGRLEGGVELEVGHGPTLLPEPVAGRQVPPPRAFQKPGLQCLGQGILDAVARLVQRPVRGDATGRGGRQALGQVRALRREAPIDVLGRQAPGDGRSPLRPPGRTR